MTGRKIPAYWYTQPRRKATKMLVLACKTGRLAGPARYTSARPENPPVVSSLFMLFQPSARIFSQPQLISFKRDKNIGNFLVRNAFQTSNQPGTFKCARTRCKTCPFICKVEKLSGPKRSFDHFTCTSSNVIYCITCTLQKVIHRRNRETTRRQIPRTPSRCRERRLKRI